MQTEKASRKTLTQNVNGRMQGRTNGQTNGQKDENYIPSTYFICRGYNEDATPISSFQPVKLLDPDY